MISVKDLKKSFGQLIAVDGLSFSVKNSEIVGFLGPNGAGKTTTMRLLTGFLSPDSGTITIDGSDVVKDPQQAQAQIGYLPENNPLYKDMLVSQMLRFTADLKKIPPKNKKTALDFVVSAVHIEDVFYRPIVELSKGYRQRVGMALALLNEPKILIVDEPTEGLDPNQRSEMRSLIKTLAKDRTIIVSTHVMQEATAIANRLIIINRGKLVADGSPEKLTQAGKSEKTLELELEGTKLATTLKSLKQIKNISSTKLKPNRFNFIISTQKGADFQPILSPLIAKNKWIVWKLVEQQKNLEDVFHILTKETH